MKDIVFKDLLIKRHRENRGKRVQKFKRILLQNYECRRAIDRPWGTYTVLENGTGFKVKRLNLKPGGEISLQLHYKRNEHWIVVKGQAEVTRDQAVEAIPYNSSIYICAGQKHRVSNRGPEELVIIEVQCGSYLGEDDIIRFEDRYGRI